MPIYEYICSGGHIFEEFHSMSESSKAVKCKCGKMANRKFSLTNLITDTSFPLTGIYDKRLGSKIEGRKDFYRKVEEKGYVPLSEHQFKNIE
jgi:putative FmdB family regulatory protein